MAYDPRLVADYIRQAAIKRGIDPDVAERVSRNEGLYGYVGDGGSSFGPFQLHYGGVAKGGNAVGGLGDIFTKRTGLDARNPDTWQAQVDFSLDEAKRGGWGPWHGWKGPAMAGIRSKYDGPMLNAAGAPAGGHAAPPGLSLASRPADMPVDALAFSASPSPAPAGPADPLGDLIMQMSGHPKKQTGNLTSFVQSLLAEQEPKKQADGADDAFLRQVMDFHNAQHMRAIQGLL